jgi:cytochrome c oxidase assembly protein subunit 15
MASLADHNAQNSRAQDAAAPSKARPLAIARWLWVVASMVLVIVAVGGITRLTESGLSITQWQPVTGILPPLSEDAWQAEFAEYRATPEFIYEAGPAGMTLADFKFIFFWEWFHRVLGRLIGVAFAVPLIWFWVKGAIPKTYHIRLLALLGLGGLQGTFGWLMVRSGLSGQMTDVSHFWLSVHLLTAFFTLAGLIWTALDLQSLARNSHARPSRLKAFGLGIAIILFVQLLLGAWVAGLNAGHASYEWPLMQSSFFPHFDQSKGMLWALTHDPFLLHFLHRWWAWIAAIALVLLARKAKPSNRRVSIAVNSVLGIQILLGIATVLSQVELWIAVAHQLVGAVLVGVTAWALHTIGQIDAAPVPASDPASDPAAS